VRKRDRLNILTCMGI